MNRFVLFTVDNLHKNGRGDGRNRKPRERKFKK